LRGKANSPREYAFALVLSKRHRVFATTDPHPCVLQSCAQKPKRKSIAAEAAPTTARFFL
jgi:hypothetical protein